MSDLPSLRTCRRFGAALLLALAPRVAWAQARLWDANLLTPSEVLPTAFPVDPDTSLIPRPGGSFRVLLASEAAWRGTVDRKSPDGAQAIASASLSHSLWVAPLPQTAVALLWSGSLARNRLIDANRLDARLGEEREALGFAWVQHVLGQGGGGSGAAAAAAGAWMDVGVQLPDRDRQDFAWILSGGRGGWSLEYGMRQREPEEDVRIANLDPAGDGERIGGLYQVRTRMQRVLLKAPAAGGRLSFAGAFSVTLPRRPGDAEFWFCDSSREADAWMGYAHAWRGWNWLGSGRFREAEAFTIGRRIPPGSEGLKRFHFARNHALEWTLGADAEKSRPRSAWRLGGGYRSYAWSSDPPGDAFDSRRETLSFNRLGLSFIANLYGGLYKVSELVSGRGSHDAWEARGRWDGRAGPLGVAAGLSLYRVGYAFEARGRTLSQRFLSLDTAEDFHRKLYGYVLGATPRLRASLEWKRCGIEAEAAQTLPLFLEARERRFTGDDENTPGAAATQPPLKNGFAARTAFFLKL